MANGLSLNRPAYWGLAVPRMCCATWAGIMTDKVRESAMFRLAVLVVLI